MSDTVTVPLNWPIDRYGELFLDHIEWWNEDSRFVVVKYSLSGALQEFGLRIDIDKQIFLDQLDDDEMNEALRSKVGDICAKVGATRRTPGAAQALHAAE